MNMYNPRKGGYVLGEIITVTISKGGVLKTSIVSNLGSAIAKTYPDKRVLLIESDPQGNLSDSFGIDSEALPYSLFDVYTGEKSFHEVKQPILHNMDIVPAKNELNDLDYRIWTSYEREGIKPFELLKDAIRDVRDDYDYILIDTPPAYSLNVGNILSITDKVIIPIQLEPYALKGLRKAVDMVGYYNERRKNPIVIAGVLATLVRNTFLHKELLKQTKQYCESKGIPMLNTVIKQSIKYAESVAIEGKPAVLSDKGSARDKELLNAYYEIMEEIIHE
ncbi:ParA family protein [Exiguobacterium sp. SH1S21]|nr:ParA family protein [Exiguobacterium sp. SH1S21]